ncbi:MAG TPA: hypothetical protein PK530_05845, partial [Anaerolineales bacterium]|nr:hypothetical protein [Anaerolineales bacterium]
MKKLYVLLPFLLLATITVTALAFQEKPEMLINTYSPVVFPGSQLPELLGTATDEIFVYAFTGGVPAQIPFQIDEQNADGMFVPNGDGLFGETEELIFMASDGGEYEPNPLLPTSGGDIYPTFIVTLSDPLSSEQAWAYIYTSPDLTPTFAEDYVSYDPGTDRITSPGIYSTGFNATHSFRDYLTLGGGADILDRDKIRLEGYVILPTLGFQLTENDVTKDGVHVIDGPVRVTRVASSTIVISGTPITGTGTTYFYGPLIIQPVSLTTPPSPVVVEYLRNSTDFNANATGMTYYDPNNPAGKTIDGTPDTLTITPAAEWQQISSADGTMITMVDLPDALNGMSTYYKDNSTTDPEDTGDQKSYGDNGFQVSNPPQNQSFDLVLQTIFLSGNQPNVGATYFNIYLNPPETQVVVFGDPTPIPTNTPTETLTPTP